MQKIALLLVLCASVLAGCRGEPSRLPPIHLNPNMDTQDKYKAQRESKFFEDKRAARQPVEGAVGRDYSAVAYGVTKPGLAQYDDRYLQEDSQFWRGLDEQGQTVTSIPAAITLNEATLQRGKERYNIYCTPCHGTAGYGDGLVGQVGVLNVPSYHQDYMKQYTPGHIYGVIANGSASGLMKGYKHQISVEDRWAIVAYVRALQHSQTSAQTGK